MAKKRDGNGLTLEQQRELCSVLAQAAPTDMPRDVYEGWMKNRRALNRAVRDALLLPPQGGKILVIDADLLVGQFVAEWQQFYREEFGLEVDFSQVRVPTPQPGFGWLMFVAKGLTLNAVYEVCAKFFPCLRYTEDLDAVVQGRNDREPTEPYAIWLRDRVEPDEELKCLSANQLAEKGIMGNTLLEALLLELWHFKRTGGGHLNIANWNLCSGSRDSDGYVPDVYWRSDKFQIHWLHPARADDYLRARSVIS